MPRIACITCSFTGPLRRLPRLRQDDDVCRQITRESLERASLRILARRYGKARNTIMGIVHRVTAMLPDSVALAQQFCPRWSGVLVFDGKVVRVYDHIAGSLPRTQWTDDERRWLHKMRWLCGVDHGTGDLPHYALADSENKIDLVLYFRTLKSIGYPLKAVVCDGNPLIPEAAQFVFGDTVVIQRCTRHFIEDCKQLLPTEEGRETERALLTGLILHIQRVIEAETLEDAGNALSTLRTYASTVRSPLRRILLAMFTKTQALLIAHLIYPALRLPHTTNDAENLFKQLMLRVKSMGRFYHQDYARHYLNAWALLRRFTPFTDCKRKRRYRNTKAPLALAGCTITNIDPLKLQNSNLKLRR